MSAAADVAEILSRQSLEVADFLAALQAIYAARYTGTVILSFRYGHPKLIEIAPQKVQITGLPTTPPS